MERRLSENCGAARYRAGWAHLATGDWGCGVVWRGHPCPRKI